MPDQRTPTKTIASFDKLPPELIESIFWYAVAGDLLQYRAVCRTWHAIASSEALWHSYIVRQYLHAPLWFPSPHDVGCLTYYRLRAHVDIETFHLVSLIVDLSLMGHLYTPFNDQLVTTGWLAVDFLVAHTHHCMARMNLPPLDELKRTGPDLVHHRREATTVQRCFQALEAIYRYEAVYYLFNKPRDEAVEAMRPTDPLGLPFGTFAALGAFTSPAESPVTAEKTFRAAYAEIERHVVESHRSTAGESFLTLVDKLWSHFCAKGAAKLPQKAEHHFMGNVLRRAFLSPGPLGVEAQTMPKRYELHAGPSAAAIVAFSAIVQMAQPGTHVWVFRRPSWGTSPFWLAAEHNGEKVYLNLTESAVLLDGKTSRCLGSKGLRLYVTAQLGAKQYDSFVSSPSFGRYALEPLVGLFMSDIFQYNDPTTFDLDERSLEFLFVIYSIWNNHCRSVPFRSNIIMPLIRLIEASFPFDLAVLSHVLYKSPLMTDELKAIVEEYVSSKRTGFKSIHSALLHSSGASAASGTPAAEPNPMDGARQMLSQMAREAGQSEEEFVQNCSVQ